MSTTNTINVNQPIKCVTLSMVSKEHRKFFNIFDTDKDGVIESRNSKGENELAKMSKKLNYDFSKNAILATSISFQEINSAWRGGYRNHVYQTLIHSFGKLVKDIRINDEADTPFSYRENGDIISSSGYNSDGMKNYKIAYKKTKSQS